jgi:hypothetical protein
MRTQPEALRLAEALDVDATNGDMGRKPDQKCHKRQAAAELRRLHSVNAELLEALKWMVANDDTNEGDDPVERLGGQSWNEYNSYWINGLNKARAAIAKAPGVP